MLIVSGSLNYDIFFKVDHFAPPKSTIKELHRYLGGSGGNSAVAAARILGDKKVAFIGAVGKDEIGRKHIISLMNEGILTNLIFAVEGVESGQAFVASDPSGETAVYSYYGANTYLSPDYIRKEEVQKAIRDSWGILITNPPLPTIKELVNTSREYGKVIFWDPGTLSKQGLSALKEIIGKIDYLMPNKNELLALTEAQDIAEALHHLKGINSGLKVIVKEGSKGSTLYNLKENSAIHISSINPLSLGLNVSSSVGCGDTYSGVYTALKHEKWEDKEALIAASCASTINLAFEGPRNSPKLNELMRYLPKCRRSVEITEYTLKK